jgi:hypothetical protein
MSLKLKIVNAVIKLAPQVMPKPKSNTKCIDVIFYWQEVLSLAEDEVKAAWRAAQEVGLIPSDDDMRALGEGEHIVVDSQLFSVLAKVSKPSERFDRDLFIATLVKKYKLEKARLEAIAESCKVPSKAALSKSVVEAAK